LAASQTPAAAMRPAFAAGVLALAMCFTVTCYFFRIPDDLRRRGKVGIWGPPNAEFNWCEPDYELADWLAEPMNTVSNLAIILPPVCFLVAHRTAWDIIAVAIVQVSIGVGSVLFHASLRYSMQLCDEVPMLWYSLLCTVCYLKRLWGWDLSLPASGFAAVVTGGILVTEQHSPIHEMWRGIMSVAFSLCVVAIAWGSTSLVQRLKADLPDKRRRVAVVAERLHTAGYIMFVLAVVCWLVDNYFCPALWRLPFGLPYPHLHTWWHLLVGAALQGLLVLFQLDDNRMSQELHVSTVLFVLPLRVQAYA